MVERSGFLSLKKAILSKSSSPIFYKFSSILLTVITPIVNFTVNILFLPFHHEVGIIFGEFLTKRNTNKCLLGLFNSIWKGKFKSGDQKLLPHR